LLLPADSAVTSFFTLSKLLYHVHDPFFGIFSSLWQYHMTDDNVFQDVFIFPRIIFLILIVIFNTVTSNMYEIKLWKQKNVFETS